MFRTVLCPSSGVLHCTHSSGICHTGFYTAYEKDQDGTSWNQFHPDPACKLSTNLHDIYHCCVYIEELLMMDKGTVRNMESFLPKINWEISASSWFYYKDNKRNFSLPPKWCNFTYLLICLLTESKMNNRLYDVEWLSDQWAKNFKRCIRGPIWGNNWATFFGSNFNTLWPRILN